MTGKGQEGMGKNRKGMEGEGKGMESMERDRAGDWFNASANSML